MYKTKEEIKNWLDEYKIKNYTINDDLTVDVDGYVILFNKNLTEIPVQFNIVNENFDCSNNSLKTLKGCPNIVYENFYCFNNSDLKSLEYLPIIDGYLVCDDHLKDTKEYKAYELIRALRK
jgi:hypothetical protein